MSMTPGGRLEFWVLLVIFLINLPVLVDLAGRRIVVDDNRIVIWKFFRRRELAWPEITLAGGLTFKTKAYLLLTTTKGFHIISNSYENFPQLIRRISTSLAPERLEAEALADLEKPRFNLLPVVAAWMAAVIIAFLIYLKLIDS